MSPGRPAAEPAGPRDARIAGPTMGPAPPPAAQPPPAARTRLPGAGTYHTFRFPHGQTGQSGRQTVRKL
jgi:hypothetical protein